MGPTNGYPRTNGSNPDPPAFAGLFLCLCSAAGNESMTPRLAASRPGAPLPARPETEVLVDVAEEERIATPWRVVLYDDNIHTFDEVISQLIKATGCTSAHAEKLAWQVHLEGKAVAYEGEFEACFRVQGILREIQLVTEIEG